MLTPTERASRPRPSRCLRPQTPRLRAAARCARVAADDADGRVLSFQSSNESASVEAAFRQGPSEAGYVEHRNVAIGAGGDADTTTSSNAQHDQLNQSDADEQHCKRHHIVFEPMPIIAKHHVHPYSNAFDNPSCSSTSSAHSFQAYFAAKILVSWFAAKIWPAFRDLWRESGMADSDAVKPPSMLLMAPGSGAFRAVLHRLAAERAEADGML